MSIDFQHSVEIARPAAEVFAYLADFENNPHWQQGMKTCRWKSETHGVGGTHVQEASVTAHIRGQPTGVLKLFGGMVKKSVAKDYGRLKKVLESK